MLRNRKLISIVSALSFLLISITAPAFSAIAKKALTAPKSISVAFPNDTTTNNVDVTWSPVANNSGYTVRIYKSPNVTKPFMTAQISQNTVTTTFSLAYNSEYRVTVQTKGTGSFSNSPESGKYSFNTNLNAVITDQPAGAVNGVALTTQPIVRIAYPSGNTVTSFTGNVVATIATGTGTLAGTITRAAVAGIATFDDLVITGTAGNFTLRFTPVGASAVTSASFALTAGAASTIAIDAGNNQSATVGTAVTTAPSVIVKDANNNPVSGVSVTFAVETGGGSITGATPTTNSSGIATLGSWTLGTSAGSNTLSATSGSLTGSPLTFTATGTAGAASTIAIDAGNTQSATVGTAVTTAPSVIVKDSNNNPVSGVSVTFAVETGGGSLGSPATVTTGVDGIATSPAWTLGTSAGSNTLSATSGSLTGSPLTFTATGTAGAASTIAINAGNNQSATAGTAVAIAPSVIVKDANSNPVSGVSVTFAVATGGGSLGSPATVTTGVDGIATSPAWTLGTSAGTNNNTVTATAAGPTGSPLTFTATGTASASSSLITTGDFTIQMWIKPTADFNNGQRHELFAMSKVDNTARLDLMREGSQWTLYHSRTGFHNFVGTGSTPVIGQWYNITLTRSSGVMHVFFNGVKQLDYSAPAAADDLTDYKKIWLGADPGGGDGSGNVLLANLRIVNGQDLFPTNFTPDVTPPAAVTGTTFLLQDVIPSSLTPANSLVLGPGGTEIYNTSYFKYVAGVDTQLQQWTNGALGTAATSLDSPVIGSIGPGGGIIYYYDSAGFNCGADFTATGSPTGAKCRYLEVAPDGWNTGSDPTKIWAVTANKTTNIIDITDEASNCVSGVGCAPFNNALAIGLGFKNSELIVTQNGAYTESSNNYAAGAARAYAGGSLSDWYLPTTAELNLLCQWNRGVALSVTTSCTGGTINSATYGAGSSGFVGSVHYWASSERDSSLAYGQYFSSGYHRSFNKDAAAYVRPVRAF